METPKVGDRVAFIDHQGHESTAEVMRIEDQIPNALWLKVQDGSGNRVVGPVYFNEAGGQGTWHAKGGSLGE